MKYFSQIVLLFFLLVSCSKSDEPFVNLNYNLKVIVTPLEGGRVTPIDGSYPNGTNITLLATPSLGYVFKEWTGGITGTTNPVLVNMSSNKNISVVFEKKYISDIVGYDAIFIDDFIDGSLNVNNWATTLWFGRTNPANNEGQWYVDNAFKISNGVLSIEALLKPEYHNGKLYDYTSGVITTHQKISFMYGKIKIRAKVPKGKGLWPAFWLLPSSQGWPPEIDIMENIGDDYIYFTNHSGTSKSTHSSVGANIFVENLVDEFHIYELDWNLNEIIWSFDGTEVFRTDKNIPKEKMYFIANLAVGGSWPGYPDSSTSFPSYLKIDYVKIYQKKNP